MTWNRTDLNVSIGHSFANGGGVDAETIGEAIESCPPPSALVDVMNRGKHGRGTAENAKKPCRDVGGKGVAVDDIRMKCAQETMRVREARAKTHRRFSNVESDGFKRCRPFVTFARSHHKQHDVVPACLHALRESYDLALSSADAERREHVGDAHDLSSPPME